MTRTALIDGDSFLYRAGFAVEKTKYLVASGGFHTPFDSMKEVTTYVKSSEKESVVWSRKEMGALEDARAVLDGMLRKVQDATKCYDYNIYLTPSTGNFRDSVGTLKRYKGDRPSRPVFYSDLREHMVTAHRAIVARGEEADDMISWVARQYFRNQSREYIIVSSDKDLMQIPGDHYDWVKNEFKNLSEDEARLWYWAQVLAGDPGDNVGGCWGLGLAQASKFLVQCNGLDDGEMWPKIVRKYKDSQKLPDCPYKDKGAADVALETARLVRLRQVSDEELWTPKLKRGKDAQKEQSNSAEGAGE